MKRFIFFSIILFFSGIYYSFSADKQTVSEEIIEEIIETNKVSNSKNTTKKPSFIKKKSSSVVTNKKPVVVKSIVKKNSGKKNGKTVKTSTTKKIKRVIRNYYPKKETKETNNQAQKVEVIVKHEYEKQPDVKDLNRPIEIKPNPEKTEHKSEEKGGFLEDYFLKPNHSGVYITGGYGYIARGTIGGDHRYSNPLDKQSRHSFYLGAGFTFAKIGNDTTNLFLNLEGFYHQFDINVHAIASYNGVLAGTFVNTMNSFSIKYMLGGKFRAGIAFSRLAFFGTVGLGYSYVSDNCNSIAGFSAVDYSSNQQGFVLSMLYGGGVDFLLTDWFFVRFEYLQTLISFPRTMPGIYNNVTLNAIPAYDTKYRLSMILIGAGIKFSI